MAETTDFVSRISVKDLISAYENKSGMVRVEFTRPRARSFGNVLNKNVVVRLNELTTLDDIEKSLTKLETNLNFYEVYNKAKHVSFQEQFFNILTSIANIENEDEDAPNRKKRLISRTQTLVSFLNQKLPSNINQVVETISNIKKIEANGVIDSAIANGGEAQPSLYIESSSSPVDVTDSGGEYFVSVKKLKENFQPKIENGVQQAPKPEKITASSVSTKQSQIETTVPENAHEEKLPEAVPSNKEEPTGPVSVTKLRSLFEQRSEENSKGLEIITVDKQPLLNNLGGSVQNLSLAYTERNLGTYRLKRSVSGNYMNYSGLLKRVDINKSNSVVDLHRNGVGNSIENMGVEDTIKNGNIEEAAHQSQNSSKDNRNEEHVAIVKGSSEVQVKYSTSTVTELEQNDSSQNPGDDQVYYSTATFTTGNQNLDPHNENTASHQGFGEEEVRYSKSASVPVNQTESSKEKQTLSYQGFNEETVGYSRADSVEEDTGTKTNTITDNELSFKGVDEIEINSGTAVEVTNVAEHVAKLEAAISENVSESTTISGTETAIIERNTESFSDGTSSSSDRRHLDERETGVNHVAKTDDVTDEDSGNSGFYSFHDDEREQSLIEEVIDKMDVEQTLANVNLVVNPEDLKNADDEFEKLVENNESSKVTS